MTKNFLIPLRLSVPVESAGIDSEFVIFNMRKFVLDVAQADVRVDEASITIISKDYPRSARYHLGPYRYTQIRPYSKDKFMNFDISFSIDYAVKMNVHISIIFALWVFLLSHVKPASLRLGFFYSACIVFVPILLGILNDIISTVRGLRELTRKAVVTTSNKSSLPEVE